MLVLGGCGTAVYFLGEGERSVFFIYIYIHTYMYISVCAAACLYTYFCMYPKGKGYDIIQVGGFALAVNPIFGRLDEPDARKLSIEFATTIKFRV